VTSEQEIDVHHCDETLFLAPRNPAAEVIEHLGLKDPAHIARVTQYFDALAAQKGVK
jgi:hypothetical protein